MNARLDLRERAHDDYLRAVAPVDRENVPNIVLVFVDDMGHGDLSCFGSTAISTPNLDAMAENGVKLSAFYASSPVCSPSRFGCLTGRYPTRGFVHGVFFPSKRMPGRVIHQVAFPRGVRGILRDEVTVAEALQAGGYRTGLFGKWHLGDTSPHLPNERGFDHFFGSYYSNDMEPYAIYRNGDIAIEAPADQTRLTQQLTAEMTDFIDSADGQPFFCMYASPFPHDPVHASPDFTGSSNAGTYGDCVQELDWSVGEIRACLDRNGLTDNTLVIFTSDNGPWHEGSPGFHRGRKNNSFDGGQVVPFIATYPGVIPAGSERSAAAMNIDFFPTFLGLAGIDPPTDRKIDGVDMMAVLAGESEQSLHEYLYFVKGKKLLGVRSRENKKYMVRQRSDNGSYAMLKHGPFLFDLEHDENESYNVRDHFPDDEKLLRSRLEAAAAEMSDNPRGWL